MGSADVRQFWDEQANEFGESDLATAPDHHYRLLEIDRIKSKLIDHQDVLDVGCGNGYSTLEFAKANPHSTFTGIDYSAPMIEHAKAAAKAANSPVVFSEGDVRNLDQCQAIKGKRFDTIISERCLINLKDWDEQQEAILGLRRLLKPTGRIILVENTQEGLANLNKLRAQFGLHEIKVRWHNFYIPQNELERFAVKNFRVETVENIGNLYYILSRVLYAKLAQIEGVEPKYDHIINQIAADLPSLPIYQFSPNFIYVLANTKNAARSIPARERSVFDD